MGDGTSTLFWHDNWCTGGPLKISFPRLFSIAVHQDALICQMGRWQDEGWEWNLCWRRGLYDWEVANVERLTLIIIQVNLERGKKDGACWKGVLWDRYPTKEIANQVHETYIPILPKEMSSFIWSIKVPPRAHIIIWLAHLEKLKTGDVLVARGVIDPNLGLCPFCANELESNSHVLFTYSFSWGIWMEVLH